MTNYTQSGYPKGLGMHAPLLMRTDSDRNLSAEADPNPARKTRERVLTYYHIINNLAYDGGVIDANKINL